MVFLKNKKYAHSGGYRYNYVGDLIERLVQNNGYPLQLELHPGMHCGPFDCIYCYGKQQKLCDGLMSISDYSNLFDELNGHQIFVEMSGIKSDPLSYPDFIALLKLVKEKRYNFGIHTKGYLLNDRLIELLTTDSDVQGYITIGVDSANPSAYNELHGLNPASKVYEITEKKILNLCEEKIRKRSSLKINLAYLLFRNNSSEDQIKQFINTFGNYVDVIRFSIPQVPNVAEPVLFLNGRAIQETLNMFRKYHNGSVAAITVLSFQQSKHDNSFEFCWSQRFNATIDKAGNVFPCPQVALMNYEKLSLGNVLKEQFWSIWNSEKRKKMLSLPVDSMNCRVCDRKDESINKELNKLLNINRFLLNKEKSVEEIYEGCVV